MRNNNRYRVAIENRINDEHKPDCPVDSISRRYNIVIMIYKSFSNQPLKSYVQFLGLFKWVFGPEKMVQQNLICELQYTDLRKEAM